MCASLCSLMCASLQKRGGGTVGCDELDYETDYMRLTFWRPALAWETANDASIVTALFQSVGCGYTELLAIQLAWLPEPPSSPPRRMSSRLPAPWNEAVPGRPLVVSHRAGGNEAPENTLAALRSAEAAGSKVLTEQPSCKLRRLAQHSEQTANYFRSFYTERVATR